MKNNLIKLLTNDKEVRFFIVDTTEALKQSNLKEMKTDFSKELYAKVFTSCSLLRGFLTSEDQRLSVNVRFNLKGYSINCEIDGCGNIHCIFSARLMAYEGEFLDLISDGATLSVTRGSWMGGMFTGTVELNSESIESCLADFYSKSEQLDTIFRTWVCNGKVRGCMVQALPFANINNLINVIDNINKNEKFISKVEWARLTNEIFSYATVIEEYSIQTECNCSKEMFFGMLMSIDTVELKQSILMNKGEELECGICGKKYLFNTNDLKSIVKIKEDG
ncbi:Hsp33 family molecular chaperone HslO [Alkaliphilus transvaalensis]|uniref:Hsp33 family molecular chaperone HslO n=1 Tax=Alkaliphilus transvaalensis TaxID=114628 RepID=UPI00047E360C|nr:Hsp33 family molecular chaperone HslO [Alkaliphilus transvaalensis]